MSLSDVSAAVIGIDLGGTNMQATVVDESNSIVGHAHRSTEPDGGQDQVVERIVQCANSACEAANLRIKDIAAVGVVAAGAIDMPRGLILEAPNLQWTDVPLRDILRDKLNRPVMLENDVNGAVWGEHHLGAGNGRGDALGVWVGTGVGGGLVIADQIHHGEFSTAGEIGHTILIPDAPSGARTVEDLCSRTGLRRIVNNELVQHTDSLLFAATGGDASKLTTRMLAEAYQRNDDYSVMLIDRSAQLLGMAIANWITMLAIDTVIIGGGMSEELGEPYLARIRESFAANVFPPRSRECRLLATQLAGDAGTLGAALLARRLARDTSALSNTR